MANFGSFFGANETHQGGDSGDVFYGYFSTGGQFIGGSGNDYFYSQFNNGGQFIGGGGNDVFHVDQVSSNYSIDGGNGFDTVYFTNNYPTWSVSVDSTSGTDVWTVSGGGNTTTLRNVDQFAFGTPGGGYTFMPVCFLSGTRLATPSGQRTVESLAIGDLVLTADGDTRPVRWIGRQTVKRAFADPLHSYPVTIREGALGDSMPARDLHVSPDHAMWIEGLLVHAGAMVNGRSIVRMAAVPERFTYFHIELEDHALVMAEGAPAETFVDNVTRRRFDNWAEYETLYGQERETGEIDLPRVKSARQMPGAILRHLQARADAICGPEAVAA